MSENRQARAVELLKGYLEKVEPLYCAQASAVWGLSTTAEDHHVKALGEVSNALDRIHSDPALFAQVAELRDGLDEPVLQRRLDGLYRHMLGKQGDAELLEAIVAREAELQQLFNTFRGELNGKPVADHELQELLDRSDDSSERQAAWETSKQVGVAVAPHVIELAKLRNTLARSQGFRDHFAKGLFLQELEEDWLDGVFTELAARTSAAYGEARARLDATRCARFGIETSALRPWHYGDPFCQGVPADAGVDLDPFFEGVDIAEVTARFFTDLGLDIAPMMAASDLHPRERKNQHAFCIDMNRAGDVRVLANLRPSRSWMATMLHEFGHAVYDRYMDLSLPFDLRGPAHILTTEAIAMLMGRFAMRPDFITRYVAPDFDAAAHAEALQWRQGLEMLTLVQWVLVMVNFERALYADPDHADLNGLWWELVERHQQVSRPESRRGATGLADWAAKIHLSIAPVYYQNYLLGELMASQLELAMGEALGIDGSFIGQAGAGPWLCREVFAPGGSVTWDALVSSATGRPLGPDAFVKAFAG